MNTERLRRFNLEHYAAYWREEAQRLELDTYLTCVLELLDPQPGEQILECGIGTGVLLGLEVARKGATLFGVDISPDLVHECRRTFADEGLPCRCEVGEAENLPYDDASFSKVYCISTTWYLPRLGRALSEMARVTRPGGRVVFDIINWFHPSQWLTFQYSRLHTAARIAKRVLERQPHEDCVVNYWARTPLRISRYLGRLGLRHSVKGFDVLLPVSLPMLGDKVNLCKRLPFFAVGLQDAPVLRYLGAKLLYSCEKEAQ